MNPFASIIPNYLRDYKENSLPSNESQVVPLLIHVESIPPPEVVSTVIKPLINYWNLDITRISPAQHALFLRNKSVLLKIVQLKYDNGFDLIKIFTTVPDSCTLKTPLLMLTILLDLYDCFSELLEFIKSKCKKNNQKNVLNTILNVPDSQTDTLLLNAAIQASHKNRWSNQNKFIKLLLNYGADFMMFSDSKLDYYPDFPENVYKIPGKICPFYFSLSKRNNTFPVFKAYLEKKISNKKEFAQKLKENSVCASHAISNQNLQYLMTFINDCIPEKKRQTYVHNIITSNDSVKSVKKNYCQNDDCNLEGQMCLLCHKYFCHIHINDHQCT